MKKFLSVLLVLVMTFGMMSVTAGADIFDTAEEIGIGEIDTSLNDYGDKEIYKVNVKADGNLTINYEAHMDFDLYVYDFDGSLLVCDTTEASTGSCKYDSRNPHVKIECNDVVGTAIGVVTYKLEKGVYYVLLVKRSDTGTSLTLDLDFPDEESPEITSLQLTLSKGSSFKLSAIIIGDSNQKIKWKSSNSSVVSVTSKGKIKAKKAGTAIITATLGDSVAEIEIKVTK